MTTEEFKKFFQDEEDRVRVIYSTQCIHCNYILGSYQNRYRNKRPFSFDEEKQTGYHDDCQKKYETWYKSWIEMWAQVGWHARMDLINGL